MLETRLYAIYEPRRPQPAFTYMAKQPDRRSTQTYKQKAVVQVQRDGAELRLVPPVHVWKRLPTESVPAFEAWQMYMEVKANGKGGTHVVAQRLGKTPALIQRWSSRHKWVERYRAYENHQMMLQEREQQTALRAEAKTWAKRRIDIRETGFETGEALIKRAKLLLQLPVSNRQVIETVKAASGEEIAVVTNLIFQQSPRDARLLAETGLKLMRLSADMSTENLGVLNENVNLDDMDDEQLDAYAGKLIEIRQKKIESGDV